MAAQKDPVKTAHTFYFFLIHYSLKPVFTCGPAAQEREAIEEEKYKLVIYVDCSSSTHSPNLFYLPIMHSLASHWPSKRCTFQQGI